MPTTEDLHTQKSPAAQAGENDIALPDHSLGLALSTHHADSCVICLSTISERAIAYPCNHLSFDFLCLASWLEQRSTCPLCNASVQRVEYDWRSPSDHKTYHVPPPPKPSTTSTLRHHAPNHRRPFRRRPAPPWDGVPASSASSTADTALDRRRLVHERNAFSLHRAPSRIEQPMTPKSFATSASLQRKARIFLRRELQVFTFLSTSLRLEFVLEYIVGMLRKLELKGADGAMENLVAEVLGRNGARLLLHELGSWLACAFERLEEWDRVVQYADREVMILDRIEGGQQAPARQGENSKSGSS